MQQNKKEAHLLPKTASSTESATTKNKIGRSGRQEPRKASAGGGSEDGKGTGGWERDSNNHNTVARFNPRAGQLQAADKTAASSPVTSRPRIPCGTKGADALCVYLEGNGRHGVSRDRR